MPTYVALMRGLNLGRRRVKMPELAACFTGLGFRNVQTILASGNVIFTTPRRSITALTRDIAAHLASTLGYDVPTQIRTAGELHAVVTSAPLGELFTDQPDASTQVTFFPNPIPAATARQLEALTTPTDRLQVHGRELYWRCATKLSASPLWTNAKANPHNDPHGTTRNLQTLQRILARLPQLP